MIDIRLPIGGLFSILGLMLIGYGIMTHGNEMYDVKSLGYNINLWWGLVMLAFGAAMLYFGVTADSRKQAAQPQDATPPKTPAGSRH